MSPLLQRSMHAAQLRAKGWRRLAVKCAAQRWYAGRDMRMMGFEDVCAVQTGVARAQEGPAPR